MRTGYAPGVATLCQGQTLSARDPATELLWNLDLPFFLSRSPPRNLWKPRTRLFFHFFSWQQSRISAQRKISHSLPYKSLVCLQPSRFLLPFFLFLSWKEISTSALVALPPIVTFRVATATAETSTIPRPSLRISQGSPHVYILQAREDLRLHKKSTHRVLGSFSGMI